MSADDPTISSLPDAIISMVRRLVANEGVSFPILATAMGLNGSVECLRVEQSGPTEAKCHRIVGKLVDSTFKFPINMMFVDGNGKGYLAVIVATPQMALEVAARAAQGAGFRPLILGNAIEGEAREIALVHTGIERQCLLHAQPVEPPCVLISGGETTVTLRGHGRGGRNTEFLLGLAIALGGRSGISAIASDTDGNDGSEDNAGAILTPETLARAAAVGLDAKAHLAANDAYGFLPGSMTSS